MYTNFYEKRILAVIRADNMEDITAQKMLFFKLTSKVDSGPVQFLDATKLSAENVASAILNEAGRNITVVIVENASLLSPEAGGTQNIINAMTDAGIKVFEVNTNQSDFTELQRVVL